MKAPRFLCRSHVYQWTSQMLRTARAVYGDSREYHLIVKRVLIEKRRALKALQPAHPPSPLRMGNACGAGGDLRMVDDMKTEIEWHPIKTAPNHTEVLVANKRETCAAMKIDGDWLLSCGGELVTGSHTHPDSLAEDIGFRPTHWAHLPKLA